MLSVVMLVSFVVVLGIIITAWSNGLIGRNIELGSTRVGTDLECISIKVSILESGNKYFVKNENSNDKELKGYISRFIQGNNVYVDYKNENVGVSSFGVSELDILNARNKDGSAVEGYVPSPEKIEVIPQIEINGEEVVDCVQKTAIYVVS
jgi:hypothetical protein